MIRLMSLRAQLTLWFTLLFGAIVLALAFASYVLVRHQTYSRVDTALQVAIGATSLSAQHELSEHPDQAGGEADLQMVLDGSSTAELADTQILVREGNRNVAYKHPRHAAAVIDMRDVPSPALESRATEANLRIAESDLRVPRFGVTYQIYAARPMSRAFAQLRRLLVALLVLVPLGLVIAAASGYFVASRLLKPLQDLTHTVQKVTSSDLSARVGVPGSGGEIGTLASQFNSLLDRLQVAFSSQRRFMADASHQIRTPLTVALAAAQVVNRDQGATVTELRESLTTIENQVLRLRKIVEDMFFLSQTDVGGLPIESHETHFDESIADAVRAAKPLARAKGQTLSVTAMPEAKCLGDGDLLQQAVLILLDNALKFTPSGGTIEVALRARGDVWVCSVADNGAGIPEEHRAHIFERFYKAAVAEQPNSGAGLGLAIAKSIAERHGGCIRLAESRPGRTVFEMEVPSFMDAMAETDGQATSAEIRR